MRMNGTGDLIDRLEYPTTCEEIIDEHGEHTIELQAGEETLGAVLGRLDGESFRDPGEVRTAVRTCVCADAVGRRHYSDRDPTALGESGPTPLSF